jgi:hypothetical protein
MAKPIATDGKRLAIFLLRREAAYVQQSGLNNNQDRLFF